MRIGVDAAQWSIAFRSAAGSYDRGQSGKPGHTSIAFRSAAGSYDFKTPWPGDPRVNIQKGEGGKAKGYQVKQVIKAIDRLLEGKERSPS